MAGKLCDITHGLQQWVYAMTENMRFMLDQIENDLSSAVEIASGNWTQLDPEPLNTQWHNIGLLYMAAQAVRAEIAKTESEDKTPQIFSL